MEESKKIEIIQKLRRTGGAENSTYVVTIPKDIVEKENLKIGDRLRLYLAPVV